MYAGFLFIEQQAPEWAYIVSFIVYREKFLMIYCCDAKFQVMLKKTDKNIILIIFSTIYFTRASIKYINLSVHMQF